MPFPQNVQDGYLGLLNASQFAALNPATYPMQRVGVDNGDGTVSMMMSTGSAWRLLSGLTPAQSAAVQTKPDIKNLPEPWAIIHRSAGSQLAPEGTFQAYNLSATFGENYIVDVGDWYNTADGQLFDVHSSELSDVTNLSGLMSTKTGNAMRRCTVDATRWYAGFGFVDQIGAMAPEDVFPKFAGRCLAPESKTLVAAQYLSTYIASLGMQNQCLINTFFDSHLPYYQAKSFPYVARNVAGGADMAVTANPVSGVTRMNVLKGLGVKYLFLDADDANFVAASTNAIANGMKVVVYTTNAGNNLQLIKQEQRHQLEALNIPFSGYVTDDVLFFMNDVAKYRLTTDPFQQNAGVYHGHHDRFYTRPPTASTNRGSIVGGKLRMTNSGTNNNFILQGWGCPIANAAGTYTINCSMTFVAIPADLTRWLAIVVCCPTDLAYTDAGGTNALQSNNGYQIFVTMSNGTAATLNIFRKVDGVGTALGGSPIALSAPIIAGNTINLKIDITPTTLKVTVTGAVTGTSPTITDSTHRGAFFQVGHASLATGTITGDFGPITIT